MTRLNSVRLLLNASVALAAMVAAPAMAQTTPTPAEPEAVAENSDIVVTARQRAEDLEKVPLAVSVVGGALLDRSYTVNTSQ
uniref:hypothetical protein n=1 Tax=Pseudomonas sp. EL_65y_Pfl1_R83 TaxID=3088697 RepID=UPI0030D74DB3